ncbi:MAG: hypothetical protein ACLPZR_25060, partial [Solirubrobacteraceae bacterium]
MTDANFEQPEPSRRRRFDAEEWQTLGIAKDEGESWWKHRIEPADALRWRRAGVPAPIDAVRWRIAGVDPSTVREWIYAEIDAREAVVWAELGFNAARARVHRRAGRTPVKAYGSEHRVQSVVSMASVPGGPTRTDDPRHQFMQAVMSRHPQQRHVIHSYMFRQWFDDEAITWAIHGFDASDAIAWKELGLTPIEAQCQQDRGASAMQTAKAWWRAGIPVDEVADWIGAGLTPEEAREQRANGVTVEQAAVLRSLRKSQGP